jgi:hypothetical protein
MINEFGVLDARLYERNLSLFEKRMNGCSSDYKKKLFKDFEEYNELYDNFLGLVAIFWDKRKIPVRRQNGIDDDGEWTVPFFCDNKNLSPTWKEEDQYYIEKWLLLVDTIEKLANTNYVQFKCRQPTYFYDKQAQPTYRDDGTQRAPFAYEEYPLYTYGKDQSIPKNPHYLWKNEQCASEYKKLLYSVVYQK